jgi:small multidrug resistance family-3 protein
VNLARDVGWMLLAGVTELLGCYAIWLWIRQGRTTWLVPLGIGSLTLFAWALAQIPMTFAGRTFAAYRGVYVATALGWLIVVEQATPTRWDWLGVALCLAGTTVLLVGRR